MKEPYYSTLPGRSGVRVANYSLETLRSFVDKRDLTKIDSILKRQPEYWEPIFSYCCRHGYLDMIEYFHNKGGFDKFIFDVVYVQEASKYGHIEVVRYLMNNNSALNSSAGFCYPLLEAAENDHMEVVVFLITRGASVKLMENKYDNMNDEIRAYIHRYKTLKELI